MKYRIISVCLVIIILISTINASFVDTSLEKDTASNIVIQFLNLKSRNEWLLESHSVENCISQNTKGSDKLSTFLAWVDLNKTFNSLYSDLRVKDFKATYKIESIEMLSPNRLSIRVTEKISFIYVIGDGEVSYLKEVYDFVLEKQQDSWKIIDIDMPYGSYTNGFQSDGFDKQKLLTSFKQAYEGKGQPLVQLESNQEEWQLLLASTTTTTIPYTASTAVDYATTFWETYNPKFSLGGAADCANFTSQCVWAGLGGDESRTNATAVPNSYPQDFASHDGSSTGYVANYQYTKWHKGSSAWNGAVSQFGYAYNSSHVYTNDTGIYADTYGPIEDNQSNVPVSLPGTISYVGAVFYVQGASSGGHPMYGHAMFCDAATGNSFSNIYLTAHNSDVYHLKLANAAFKDQPIRVMKPLGLRVISNCSVHQYTSYPSGQGYDATCNNCGYRNMFLNFAWGSGSVNSPKLIYAGMKSGSCYRLEAYITTNGIAGSTPNFTSNNSSGVSGSYTFTQAGNYIIVIRAYDSYTSYMQNNYIDFTYRVRIE